MEKRKAGRSPWVCRPATCSMLLTSAVPGFVWVSGGDGRIIFAKRALERLLRTFHGAVVRVWLAEGDSSRRHPGARRSVEIGPPVRCEVLRGPGPLPAPFGNPSLVQDLHCAGRRSPVISGSAAASTSTTWCRPIGRMRGSCACWRRWRAGPDLGTVLDMLCGICRGSDCQAQDAPSCLSTKVSGTFSGGRLARPPGLLYRRLAWQGIWSRHRLAAARPPLRRRMSSSRRSPRILPGTDCATSFFPMA